MTPAAPPVCRSLRAARHIVRVANGCGGLSTMTSEGEGTSDGDGVPQ